MLTLKMHATLKGTLTQCTKGTLCTRGEKHGKDPTHHRHPMHPMHQRHQRTQCTKGVAVVENRKPSRIIMPVLQMAPRTTTCQEHPKHAVWAGLMQTARLRAGCIGALGARTLAARSGCCFRTQVSRSGPAQGRHVSLTWAPGPSASRAKERMSFGQASAPGECSRTA